MNAAAGLSPALIPEPVSAAEAAALFAGLAHEKRLLIAVSGGPDSVALLVLLAQWARQANRPPLHAATVDHGLRPASAAEARGVAALCATLAVSHATLIWQGTKPATRLQEQARRARYALLGEEAARLGGAVVVSAHTADDQAETILMRMARGSGPAGLAGMKTRTRKAGVTLARPLLGLPKDRLVATAQAHGACFVQDPSNADTRFERVRWRELMPTLGGYGLTPERLATLSRRMARMEQALAHRTATWLEELRLPSDAPDAIRLHFASILAEPPEIALRIVGAALDELATDGESFARLERLEACVDALLDAGATRSAITRTLSGCLVILDRDGNLTLRREGPRRRGIHSAA